MALTPLFGQVPVLTQKAELAVPFGTVAGYLLTVKDYLIFVDEGKPESTFAVPQGDLREFTIAEDLLTVETANPVRDRSGSRSKLTFRLSNPKEAASLIAWHKAAPQPAPAAAQGGKDAALHTYEVKHDHRLGGCNGRLILEANRILFESITDLEHSRQWSLRDVKELKRSNPYSIRIAPFAGDTYSLQIQGQGMDGDEYRALVDRVTAARVR